MDKQSPLPTEEQQQQRVCELLSKGYSIIGYENPETSCYCMIKPNNPVVDKSGSLELLQDRGS